jgi:endonuclease/exonuclease/phosphatase family metal-dependent hydrolase
MSGTLRVVTYNIHKCRGMDRRVDPGRIVQVLRKLDADVIALQEVVRHAPSRSVAEDQAQVIADALGYQMTFGQTRTMRRTAAPYGNSILSRLPVLGGGSYDITASIRERRGCMRADLQWKKGRVLHIFNAHLGTGYLERRKQGRMLVSEDVLNNPDYVGSRLLVGDFNEWTVGLATQLLRAHMVSVDLSKFVKRAKTYPGMFPLVHLDHIYFDPLLELKHFEIVRDRLALVASDHLPLIADFIVHDKQ